MIKTIITEKVEKIEEIDSIVCDICEREFKPSDWIDWQEFFSFKNYCGYGSVFGDGTEMRVDICQNCMKKILDTKTEIKKMVLKDLPYYAVYNGKGDAAKFLDMYFRKGERYQVEVIKLKLHPTVKFKDDDGEYSADYFDIDFKAIVDYNIKIVENIHVNPVLQNTLNQLPND